MGRGIPASLGAKAAGMDIQEQMTNAGFDPASQYDEYIQHCKNNPGVADCSALAEVHDTLKNARIAGENFGDIAEKKVERAQSSFERFKGALKNAFDDAADDPGLERVLEDKANIKQQFESEYTRNSLSVRNGGGVIPMNPGTIERLEQLAIKHPDEVDSRFMTALNKIKSGEIDVGVEMREAYPIIDRGNEGMVFSGPS